jgi:hypothetical protein
MRGSSGSASCPCGQARSWPATRSFLLLKSLMLESRVGAAGFERPLVPQAESGGRHEATGAASLRGRSQAGTRTSVGARASSAARRAPAARCAPVPGHNLLQVTEYAQLVHCGGCGSSFDLSVRNVRAARQRGEEPLCSGCRHPGKEPDGATRRVCVSDGKTGSPSRRSARWRNRLGLGTRRLERRAGPVHQIRGALDQQEEAEAHERER